MEQKLNKNDELNLTENTIKNSSNIISTPDGDMFSGITEDLITSWEVPHNIFYIFDRKFY
jgi:hypothetical protein